MGHDDYDDFHLYNGFLFLSRKLIDAHTSTNKCITKKNTPLMRQSGSKKKFLTANAI